MARRADRPPRRAAASGAATGRIRRRHEQAQGRLHRGAVSPAVLRDAGGRFPRRAAVCRAGRADHGRQRRARSTASSSGHARSCRRQLPREDAPNEITAPFRRGVARACGAAARRERAGEIPQPSDQVHRAVPGRRHQRRAGADRRRQAAGQVGPADHHRAEDRRRRQHRRRRRGQGRAGRPHAVRQRAGPAVDQPEPLQEAVLSAARFRADHRAGRRCRTW